MEETMFTIVIPLYNKENYIEDTVQSVINQTYQNFKIVIVDDGSTDNSLGIIKNLYNNNSKIRIISQQNKGVSAARNLGLSYAHSKYICFLDADDVWRADCLFEFYRLFVKYCCKVVCVAQVNYKLNERLKRNEERIIDNYCKYNCLVQTSCICCERYVFDIVGNFADGVQMGEDRDMWLRISCKFPFVFCNKELVFHLNCTQNNLGQMSHPLDKTFPYWKWYYYKTDFKQNINKYASDMLLFQAFDLYKDKKYMDSLFILSKMSSYNSFKRFFLLIKNKFFLILNKD